MERRVKCRRYANVRCTCDLFQNVYTYKKFWEELIAYFPFIRPRLYEEENLRLSGITGKVTS